MKRSVNAIAAGALSILAIGGLTLAPASAQDSIRTSAPERVKAGMLRAIYRPASALSSLRKAGELYVHTVGTRTA